MACSTDGDKVTRQSLLCPILGSVCDLPANQLPTYNDIIKCVIWNRNELKQACKKDPSIKEISKTVVETTMNIYKRASIPTVSDRTATEMILQYHSKYRLLMKSYKSRKTSASYKEKVKLFLENSKKLFDICSCKCTCSCICPKERKIPALEQNFINDQRQTRNMIIGGVDKTTTDMLRKREARKNNNSLLGAPSTSSGPALEVSTEDSFSSDSTESTMSIQSDDEYVPSRKTMNKMKDCESSSQNNESVTPKTSKSLQSFAEACDRVGVSDRGAALLSTSLLEDIGLVDNENMSEVIDRSKVRRERKSYRDIITASEPSEITSLYFDGRKDATYVVQKIGDRNHKRKITEEHITVISEPDSKYIGHFTPVSGAAQNIANELLQFATDKLLSINSLIAVGCDGTAVNTGRKGGIIKILEESLQKPLHWFICLLHANELPLRHLIGNIDGKTSGPTGFTGPIGKKLKLCETLPVVNFDPISATLDFISHQELSTDQKYLYDIHKAITEGHVSEQLAERLPGNLNHSRWLTTANRILRLYVATENASKDLVTLTSFIMTVYAPMWFSIKRNPYVQDGPKHLFKTMQLIKTQDQNIKNVVYPVVQRNAYFAHPENILISMIQDEVPRIRELAWRRIKKARNARQGENTYRIFQLPELNFDCTDYISIIDWKNSQTQVTEPPLTMGLTDEEIDSFISSKTIFNFSNYPSHTQAVERHIKLVTEASSSVCSHDAREGFIQARLASRKRIPSFDTKKQFSCN
jgi:hypothetical protein